MPGFDPDAAAWQVALEFLAGYVVEYSLSVDNIFVFVLVLGYFARPARYQHRVLFYGILGALVFRAIFIALGAVLHAVPLGRLALRGLPGRHRRQAWCSASERRRRAGAATCSSGSSGARAGHAGLPRRSASSCARTGGCYATPLLVALLCLEITDIVFAVDSVPAIFALTREPFIVFTSNIFAILGLRSMYFMLGGAIERFHMLSYGLAVVLVFVGLKMVWLDGPSAGSSRSSGRWPSSPCALAASVVASLVFPPPRDPAATGPSSKESATW